MNKEQIIKILLEDELNLFNKKDLFLIKESIESIDDPQYQQMVNYYTRSKFGKEKFDSLNDKDKLKAINLIDGVVNGSKEQLKHPDNGFPSVFDDTVLTILAGEITKPNNEIEGWKPDYVDTQNIYEFILKYYNPYSKTSLKNSAYRAASSISNIDPLMLDIDIIITAFVNSIDYLLLKKNFDPDRSTFDYYLVQEKWKNEIIDNLRKKRTRKDLNIDPEITKGSSSEGDDETVSAFDLAGVKDPEYSLMNDTDKFNYLFSLLDTDNERKVLKGFYNYIFSETITPEEAAKKLIDTLSDNDGDITQVDSEEKSDEGSDDGLNQFIAKEFGIEYSGENESLIKAALRRTRDKLKKIFSHPKFKENMGLEDWSEKNLEIMKATGRTKKPKKQAKDVYITKPEEEFYSSGIAYDKFGKPIIKTSKDQDLDEIMMECLEGINFNFNNKLDRYNKNINRIKFISKTLNEGNEVAVKDLDQDIYNYILEAVDGLNKANHMLNELELVGNDIKFEYPQISEKIFEYVTPLLEKITNLASDIKSIKDKIKPYLKDSLYESPEKKKNSLNDDELEEERITNPESKNYVRKRENFIGSHIYGEDLGGLGKMYVAYSYGEQFPVYLWYKNKWYHNANNYVLDDNTINEPTNQHKKDMRPAQDTHGLSTLAMNTMIRKFKKKHGLGDNVHTDVEPGEKN